MNKTIFNVILLMSSTSYIKAQHLLEALEKQDEYISIQSVTKSGTFRRNNCSDNGVGEEATFSVTKSHTYISDISQQDADDSARRIAGDLAQNEVNSKGQNYVNSTAKCIWIVNELVSQTKRFSGYQNAPTGRKCNDVEMTATVWIMEAKSDISYAFAYRKAIDLGNKYLSDYLNSYQPNFSCVEKYTCTDSFEEEYLISSQTEGQFSSCPVGTRSGIGGGLPYTSTTDKTTWNRFSIGSSSAQCRVRYYDWLIRNYKTENRMQALQKYKSTRCTENPTPTISSQRISLGTKYADEIF